MHKHLCRSLILHLYIYQKTNLRIPLIRSRPSCTSTNAHICNDAQTHAHIYIHCYIHTKRKLCTELNTDSCPISPINIFKTAHAPKTTLSYSPTPMRTNRLEHMLTSTHSSTCVQPFPLANMQGCSHTHEKLNYMLVLAVTTRKTLFLVEF